MTDFRKSGKLFRSYQITFEQLQQLATPRFLQTLFSLDVEKVKDVVGPINILRAAVK